MNKTEQTISIASIVSVDNSRLPNLLAIDTLADDIMANGLQVRPIVALSANVEAGQKEQVTGHRRLAAVRLIEKRDPARFAELFPNGEIEVVVLENATQEDIVRAKVDQGNQITLTHPMELQKAANMLFSVSMTEADVAVSLAGLLDSMYPMSRKNSDILTVLEKSVIIANGEGNDAEAADLKRQVRKHILDVRRGVVQGLHNTYRAPDVVFASRWYAACGEKLEAVESLSFIPKLTVSQTTKLWGEFSKDLGVVEGGERKFSKALPGPKFWKAWNAIVTAQKAAANEPTVVRAKAMSAKAMKAEVSDGKWDSNGFNGMSRHHAGDDVPSLKESDALLAVAELVHEHSPELWAEVTDEAKAIRAALLADIQSAAADEAETEAALAEVEAEATSTTDEG